MIAKQLVAQNLAGLGAPGHGVDVEVGKGLLGLVGLPAVGEDFEVVVEDGAEKVVLDVGAPERLAVLLLEVADLADGVLLAGVLAAAAARGGARLGGAHLDGAVFVFGLGDVGHEGLVVGVVVGVGRRTGQVGGACGRGWGGCHGDAEERKGRQGKARLEGWQLNLLCVALASLGAGSHGWTGFAADGIRCGWCRATGSWPFLLLFID